MTNDKYQLVELTDLNEIEHCHKANFVEWASGLSLDDYLIREKGVKLKLSQDDMYLTYWGLQVKQDDGEWQLVSAFESARRPALYKKKGYPVDQTISHSIGSVFTPKQFRGRGYAREMMTRGVEKLSHYGNENLTKEQKREAFIALWSDIKGYYSQFGYKKVDINELKIKIAYRSADSNINNNQNGISWPSQVRAITDSDEVARLAGICESQMIKNMDKKTEEDGVTRVSIAPRPAVFAHTHWRSQYAGPILTKGPEKGVPQVLGVHCGKTSALLCQEYGSNKVYILQTITDEDSTTEQATHDMNLILQAAINEAQKWGLEYVCLWPQDIPTVTSLEKIQKSLIDSLSGPEVMICEREGSWPMYCVPNDPEPVEWFPNGKYAWF